jgi:Flp pilus assembly protein TadD
MAAMIVEAQGKTQEAQQRYERLVDANPHAAVAANNLAYIYATRGEQLDRALQLAQSAKADLPDNASVSDTLAFVYIKKQLGSLAIPLLRQAIEKQPEEAVIHFHLGLAYAQTGDKIAARQALQKALNLKADFEGADEARKLLTSLN